MSRSSIQSSDTPAHAARQESRAYGDASSLVSIVIPALNEEATLSATLASVAKQAGPLEIFVVDGGSDDATPRVVASHHGVALLNSPAGRARQMNAGAERATGDILLFLHADTRLPPGALDQVREALADADAGCFRLRFDRSSFWLWLWTRSIWLRWPRWAFGDRGLFVRRDAFDAVGGFPNQPIFEDLDIVQSLCERGRFVFLDATVTTSARRYAEHGGLRQQLRNLALWTAWLLGVDPKRAARYYPYPTLDVDAKRSGEQTVRPAPLVPPVSD